MKDPTVSRGTLRPRGTFADLRMRAQVDCLEVLPALDVRTLSRTGVLVSGGHASVALSYGSDELQVEVNAAPPLVLLAIRLPGGSTLRPTMIFLESTRCNLGGSRAWWRCPACARRTAILYRTGGLWSCRWVCRKCTGFLYRSQQETGPRRGAKVSRMSVIPLGRRAGTGRVRPLFAPVLGGRE